MAAKTFPKIAPEFYVEGQSDIGINPRNKDIEQDTKKINLTNRFN